MSGLAWHYEQGMQLRAVRDSSSLGVDRGMRLTVERVRVTGHADLYCESLDMMIANVAPHHLDLQLATEVLP